MKRVTTVLYELISIITVLILLTGATPAKPVKNIILFIADGMSNSGITLTRWYKGSNLALDEIISGLVRTYSSDSAITDSAPGATAYATGFKSQAGYIAVLPYVAEMPGLEPIVKGKERKVMATILEAARLSGRSTGIIATSNIQHATPACFSSHFPNRDDYETLGEQQVYQNIDIVLGGGYQYLLGKKRKDKEDLIKVLNELNYSYVRSRDEMIKTKSKKIWGMFSPDTMSYDFDRDKTKEPSISEMTQKAIDVLLKNENGFFLMVEGSRVDAAAHANDPIGVISEILAYDKAVKTALNFAKKDKNTVIIAVEDHGTGGISIGDNNLSEYYSTHINKFINPLKNAKLTGEGIERLIKEDKSNIKEVMEKYYGIKDLSDIEKEFIIYNQAKGELNKIIGPMISKRAFIGWTTIGHTGEDVILYFYSPFQEKLSGLIENTDVAKFIERSFGFSLQDTTKKLFLKVTTMRGENIKSIFETTYKKKIHNIENIQTTPYNQTLVIKTNDNSTIIFPANKDYAVDNYNKVIKKLPGVNVYNGIDWFISQEGIDLIKIMYNCGHFMGIWMLTYFL